MKISKLKNKWKNLTGNPEKIAKGLALGAFIGMTPLPGLQVLIALAVASLLNWHKSAAALAVFNTNAFTGVFVFGFNYVIGAKILGWTHLPPFPKENMREVISFILNSGGQVFVSLLVGGLLTGIPVAIGTYFLTRKIFRRKQIQVP